MRHRFGCFLARGAFVLASLVFLVGAIPGCGDGSGEQKPGEIPPVLEESNKNMENFMMQSKGGKSKAPAKAAPAPAAADAPKG